MNNILKTDVLIVGAGPTGLMAANQLMRFGIDFIIIDVKSEPTIESRAIAVTSRSLEIYQQMGLAQKAVDNGKLMTSFNIYSGGKARAEVKIGEIGKGLSEFSYMLAFEQSKNERLLTENLHKNDQEVFWNHEFIEFIEIDLQINARVKSPDEELNIKAQYVIGCEGAKSPIRHQMKFSFKGGTYEQLFFVADTVIQWDLGYHKLIVSPGIENFCAFLPLSDDKTYRILGTLPKKYVSHEDVTFEDIKETVLNTIAVKLSIESVNWFSTYKLHHRCVDRFRKGRVFLAGDSAHIHSPAGGQGMNTGLQDAYNLCWKLALVIKDQANASLLDTYNEERLPFAKWLLRFTDRGFKVMTSTNWFIRFFRKYIMLPIAGLILRSNRIRPIIFKVISQIGYSYKGSSLSKKTSTQKLRFKAGDRLPFFPEENIYPFFREASFHLLHIANEPLPLHEVKIIENKFPFSVKFVEQPLNNKWMELGVKKELFILVRPDNYMALIFDTIESNELKNYMRKHLGGA